MNGNDLGFTLLHLGINSADEAEGKATAALLAELFGFPCRETPAAIFVNEQFEVIKRPGRGRLGHIAIGTTDLSAAMEYLGKKGVTFDLSSAIPDGKGGTRLIYFADEIAGFAVHLSQIG